MSDGPVFVRSIEISISRSYKEKPGVQDARKKKKADWKKRWRRLKAAKKGVAKVLQALRQVISKKHLRSSASQELRDMKATLLSLQPELKRRRRTSITLA